MSETTLVASRRLRLIAAMILTTSLLVLVQMSPSNAHHSDRNRADTETPQVEVENDTFELPPGVVKQSEAEAEADDIARTAAETGLSTSAIKTASAFRAAFDTYVGELRDKYDGQIAAAFAKRIPAMEGILRFVGDVPPDVVTEISRRGWNVALSGGHGISIDEQHMRNRVVAQALVDARYSNFVSFYDVEDDVIRVRFKVREGHPQPDRADVAAATQRRLSDTESPLQGRAAQVLETDIEVEIKTGNGPIVTPAHSRGGNWLRDGNVNECTSGWSVNGSNGNGIVTAGHCDGLEKFLQPGVTAYNMLLRAEENGLDGDVEYHTTSHIELAEFYATATSIRDTVSFEATSTMENDVICFYGRESNDRKCNHTITAESICVAPEGGPPLVCKLARATNDNSELGDSGGGWSYSTRAYGVHHGFDDDGNGYFTPIEEMEDALNVTILLQ